MKAPAPHPTLRLVDKVSRSCGHTPGKVAGQRATVKAEMNGVTPGLDRRPPPRWMGGQGGQSLKVLGCINRREFAICTEKTCHSIGDFLPPRRPPFHQKALPAIPPTELGDTNLLLRVL